MPLRVITRPGARAQHRAGSTDFDLASVETGAGGRLFGVVALEGLGFQGRTVLETTDGGFFDETVASGLQLVHAAGDVVVATDWDFLGRVGSRIVLASHFDLEGSLTFGPRAAESAFDDFAFLVTLDASGGEDLVLGGVDSAFEGDVVVEKTIAIVQTFAVVDATGGLDGDLLATNAGAVEPEFAIFERFSGVVLFALFHATGGHQASSVVDGFVADHDEIVLVDFFVQVDAFALVDASLVDGFQSVAVAFAGVEVGGVFELLVDLVFLALMETGGRFDGQQIAVQGAGQTVGFPVERAADFDVFQIVGQTTFRHNITIATFVEETSAFQLGAI